MAPSTPEKNAGARPGIPRGASYSHQQSHEEGDVDGLKPPKRAQTIQNGPPVQVKAPPSDTSDAFETNDNSDTEDGIEITRASVELDVLPIELVTLTDTFIESLGAKVHSKPPTIERLSQLFQDFYAQASTHINTHISALRTRQSREASPAPSASSISSAASRLRNKASSLSSGSQKLKPEAEQQMITTDELADRKQARRALELKRHMLEEAVERRLCEGIYDRIYQHKSTQDEADDDKLRSKTAALALVGIGPVDLGIDLGGGAEQSEESIATKIQEINDRLEGAREGLVRMHKSRYPLGKLNHLKAAHRSIVDTIAHFHPSASADEIMPMLIYTLITLPPENLHVISDARFIQNFRWEHKLTGEAAYCITNLEATISFLQTVDLATLRSDELPSGPAKPQVGTPKSETFPPAFIQSGTAADTETSKVDATATKPSVSPSALKTTTALRNRRLSDLVNTPAQAFGAASDAVFATADQGLKTVSNSLGDSYKFLLGKLRENQNSPRESITVPRTLDDARRLVSTPPIEEEDSELLKGALGGEDRVFSLIGGKRDRSTDSAVSGRSASSSRLNKLLFSDENKVPVQTSAPNQNPAVLDQMRNSITNSFNPLARMTNQFGMMRNFGRNVTTPPASSTAEASKVADGGDLATAFPDIAAALPPKPAPPKIAPPNKRFLELQNPGDLKLGEVLELLRDYRRLAGALKSMNAFEDR